MSGQASCMRARNTTPRVLQWRAGQLSGQARNLAVTASKLHETSMEGRTIVRPGAGGVDGHSARRVTSMEGRTIVRPGWSSAATLREWSRYFNGGPDNCPARREPQRLSPRQAAVLQWRAGQLSGQATPPTACLLDPRTTSMEGRTIVRPGVGVDGRPRRVRPTSMEGRTIVRPGHHQTRTATPSR